MGRNSSSAVQGRWKQEWQTKCDGFKVNPKQTRARKIERIRKPKPKFKHSKKQSLLMPDESEKANRVPSRVNITWQQNKGFQII